MNLKKITYLNKAGEQNTSALLEIIEEYVNKENISVLLTKSLEAKSKAAPQLQKLEQGSASPS